MKDFDRLQLWQTWDAGLLKAFASGSSTVEKKSPNRKIFVAIQYAESPFSGRKYRSYWTTKGVTPAIVKLTAGRIKYIQKKDLFDHFWFAGSNRRNTITILVSVSMVCSL